MTPKFSVGEVVILQSFNHPHLNGECEVVEVLDRKPRTVLNSSGEDNGVINGFAYRLSIQPQNGQAWGEKAIRKKHQPGEHSFTDLMASLKNPVSV